MAVLLGVPKKRGTGPLASAMQLEALFRENCPAAHKLPRQDFSELKRKQIGLMKNESSKFGCFGAK